MRIEILNIILTRKSVNQNGTTSHGSHGFQDKMRLLIEFRIDSGDDQLRQLCIVKGNYVPADEKSKSFLLRFNENMTFDNTGVRVPYEELISREVTGLAKSPSDVKRVMQLSSKKMSCRQIANELTKEGIKTSKTAVANIIKQNKGDSISEKKDEVPEVAKPWPPNHRNFESYAELYIGMK